MSRYKTFVDAAWFEDDDVNQGAFLKIADVAARARMGIQEAQQHADRMIAEKLAEPVPRHPGCLKLDYDAIRFARRHRLLSDNRGAA